LVAQNSGPFSRHIEGEVDLLSPHSTSPVLIASQGGLSIPDVEAKMTDPAVVEEFLTRTQVRWDLLLFQLPPRLAEGEEEEEADGVGGSSGVEVLAQTVARHEFRP
jgi:hypothetical protein